MIRRFVTRVLMLLLVAACGLNWLQVRQLQQQVTQLQARQSAALPKQTPKQMIVQKHTPKARLNFSSLQSRWKHLRNQANAFRSTSKKVFHEII